MDDDYLLEDEEFEESEMPYFDEMFLPLYDGAKVTVCGALCAIMHFQRVSRCSFSTIAQLLQLYYVQQIANFHAACTLSENF